MRFAESNFFQHTEAMRERERSRESVRERETREITLCYRLSLLREKVDFFLIFFACLIEFLDFYEFFLVGCFACSVGS